MSAYLFHLLVENQLVSSEPFIPLIIRSGQDKENVLSFAASEAHLVESVTWITGAFNAAAQSELSLKLFAACYHTLHRNAKKQSCLSP